jgi:16S rRNA (uracil1498-N3)-methyltransferase
MSEAPACRLFVAGSLAAGAELALEAEQSNYLRNVLRLPVGAALLVFNGRDGEWQARIAVAEKRRTLLAVEARTRPQTPPADLWYLFAPLKHARLDYMVQKAVEMGAGRLLPVLTRRTQVARVNLERMRANIVEAAEQCGILAPPEVAEPAPLERVVADWRPGRTLVFCDEASAAGDSLAALETVADGPAAVLIGPEGGFDEAERRALLAVPGVVRLSLGPRILRADTAAVAALALVQAVRERPSA